MGRGGSMIATVSLSEGTTWTKAPWRFEAGTPNTGGIIGLGAALEYVSALGLNNIAEYEQNLDALRAITVGICTGSHSLWPTKQAWRYCF